MPDFFPRQEFQRFGLSEVAIRALEKVANIADTIERIGSAEAALGQKQPLDVLLTSLSALADPGVDKMLFWDDSAGQLGWLEPAARLSITGADLDADAATATYLALKVQGSETQVTTNVNSTVYLNTFGFAAVVDLDEFPFTEFRITIIGQSNAAAQTITGQLAVLNTPATPIHAGGNDIAIINTFNSYESGWRTRDAGPSSGKVTYTLALKGSNATVDLQHALVVFEFRIA